MDDREKEREKREAEMRNYLAIKEVKIRNDKKNVVPKSRYN